MCSCSMDNKRSTARGEKRLVLDDFDKYFVTFGIEGILKLNTLSSVVVHFNAVIIVKSYPKLHTLLKI